MRIVETLPCRVREIENIWIPAGDTSHRMAARLWLPEGAEDRPVPVILEYLPYRKRDFTAPRDTRCTATSRGTATRRSASTCAARASPTALMTDEYLAQELAGRQGR